MDPAPAPTPWGLTDTLGTLRVAVISDVHSNLPALEAVLAAIESADVSEIWCLGDVVGYGADPDACAELIRERCDVTLSRQPRPGRDSAASTSPTFSERPRQRRSTWTQENASEETIEFLAELEPAGLRAGIGLFHASPRDPVWEYVLSSTRPRDA